jgi:hypothetical protein
LKKSFLLILIPLFFSSCYFQNFDGIKKNNLNERVFENSATGRIILRDGTPKADFKVIYLSDISSKFKDSDVFLFSVYFFDNKISGLENIDYSFQLNGVKPVQIDHISKDNPIVSQVKMLNPWFHNYIIYFKKSETEKFEFSFGYDRYGNKFVEIIKGRGERRDYPTIAEKISFP